MSESVFHHKKYTEKRVVKKAAKRRIFDEPRGVWKRDETHYFSLLNRSYNYGKDRVIKASKSMLIRSHIQTTVTVRIMSLRSKIQYTSCSTFS